MRMSLLRCSRRGRQVGRVWVEIGAAWGREKRIVAVLYRVTLEELDASGGRAILEDINLVQINHIEEYFAEVGKRLKDMGDG